MLNIAINEQAVTDLNAAQAKHESEAEVVADDAAKLVGLRKSSSERINHPDRQQIEASPAYKMEASLCSILSAYGRRSFQS